MSPNHLFRYAEYRVSEAVVTPVGFTIDFFFSQNVDMLMRRKVKEGNGVWEIGVEVQVKQPYP